MNEIKEKINGYLKNSNYSCQFVSWDDVSRDSNNGNLSCFGDNITDTYLVSKDKTKLYTIRPENWNEKIGVINSNDFKVITKPKSVVNDKIINSESVTLTEFLNSHLSKEINCDSLFNERLDTQVSVRFQTTFLPIKTIEADKDTDFDIISQEFIEFCPESYNYNTKSDDDPKNVLIMCTSEGSFVSLDKKGTKKLFRYSKGKDTNKDTEKVMNEWFKLEPTRFSVGQLQDETEEEQIELLNASSAVADNFGLESMNKCMNCIATIQVPLKTVTVIERDFYKNKIFYDTFDFDINNSPDEYYPKFPIKPQWNPSHPSFHKTLSDKTFDHEYFKTSFGKNVVDIKKPPSDSRFMDSFTKSQPIQTQLLSSVGRIGKGSEESERVISRTRKLTRDISQHITITFVFYYATTVNGPTEDEVLKAVEQLNNFTRLHELKSDKASFMVKSKNNILE